MKETFSMIAIIVLLGISAVAPILAGILFFILANLDLIDLNF